jgi:hypothetical protein
MQESELLVHSISESIGKLICLKLILVFSFDSYTFMTTCIVCRIRLNSNCQVLNNYSCSLCASDIFWYKPERNALSHRLVYFRTVAGRFIQ